MTLPGPADRPAKQLLGVEAGRDHSQDSSRGQFRRHPRSPTSAISPFALERQASFPLRPTVYCISAAGRSCSDPLPDEWRENRAAAARQGEAPGRSIENRAIECVFVAALLRDEHQRRCNKHRNRGDACNQSRDTERHIDVVQERFPSVVRLKYLDL